MDRDLIQVTNRLQDVFAQIGGETVDLPQIVVVGSQSSGKSSVLENIVGRDFLPRGSGIVTRRPLVLQLVHIQPSKNAQPPASPATKDLPITSSITGLETTAARGKKDGVIEYGEFLHTQHRRYHDFDEIRKEIEAETLRIAGAAKGISKQPIHLKIYSTEVLNLTLVDLPGLTKIPVGDQPSDIERQIQRLIQDYIEKPNCVILAITPANVDLANSESLKLARKVDPQGRRTIGVLTKLDIMDAGTNAVDILNGRVYPLKLGFIGVVNRSQQDINAQKPMGEALDAEAEFFHTHPGYKNIAHRCGTRFLAKTLNQVLMNHVRDKLPDMKARLNTLMGQTQQELNAFGDPAFSGEHHRGSLVLNLMTQFVKDFMSSIDGTSIEISTKELCGGARIYYIFHDVFGHALDSIDPTHNLSTSDIRTAIRNSKGPRPSLFLPEVAFELLVKPQIKLLEPPSLRCVELVYEELMKICHNSTSPELQRYPRLHAQIIEVVSELLRERLGPTSEYVSSLIAIQAAYINTNHPGFRAGTKDFANQRAQPNGAPQPKKTIESRRSGKSSLESTVEMAEGHSSQDDDEDGYPIISSGNQRNVSSNHPRTQSNHEKHRSLSSSVHDRSSVGIKPTSNISQSNSSQHLNASSQSMHSTSPGGKHDNFLNYFFGGGASGADGGMALRGTAALPDLERSLPISAGSPSKGDNPLVGRKGLEGSAAAYDMKSLDKHLDAVSYDTPGNTGDPDEMAISLIQSLISTYFSIVRQSIQDLVPKAIMHLLVNFSRESVQNRLVSNLYKDRLFADLLQEDEGLTAERTRIKALLDSYREGFKILNEALG